jgi:asparagine synthase (glutamine-hydrolysing)
MCGISGILLGGGGGRVDADVIGRMNDAVAHRGPDDHGQWVDGPVGLAHRRLSIIDISTGQQPMRSRDGSAVIVFNGEIYNYREIKRELEAKGRVFETNSDTETILALYAEMGTACVERLRGMFAFAIWDARLRRLVLARDRVGIKPLHYALTDRALVFGSELKSVTASGLVDTTLDAQAVDDFFAHAFIRAPRTILEKVRKLEAGHVLVADLDEGLPGPAVSIHRYWRLPPHGTGGRPEMDGREAGEELVRLLEDSVRMRLISEVPLGAFLSGGIDSSTIVWLMSRVSSEPVRTFTIGFREEGYDERTYARAVARRFGTRHTEEVVTPDAVSTLPLVLAAHDEPFGDPSSIPTWYVSRMARDHVTVCLSGDGGDELFAGYRRHAAIGGELGRTGVLPAVARRLVSRAGRRLLAPEARWRNIVERLELEPEEHYGRYRSIFTPSMRRRLYSRSFGSHIDMRDTSRLFCKVHEETLGADAVSRLLASDFTIYLPDDVLTKVDRMSMAHGLECRVPLLDHEVVEFVTRLPISMKLRGGTSKRLLRELIAPHMPPVVLSHDKQGFSVPVAGWLRNELRSIIEEVVRGSALRSTGMFEPSYLDGLYRMHLSGRRDMSWQLWQVLIFGLWHSETRPGLFGGAKG